MDKPWRDRNEKCIENIHSFRAIPFKMLQGGGTFFENGRREGLRDNYVMGEGGLRKMCKGDGGVLHGIFVLQIKAKT